MQSAIYRGTVRHRRLSPKHHEFRYRVFMMFLDLDELDTVFHGSRLWSTGRAAPAWFRRGDYLAGAPALADAVRDRVAEAIGRRPDGPVRMLTNLRYFGFIMNPITCYYCYEPDGETLAWVVAEVTNTPWRERHAYVISCSGDGVHASEFPKAMHVSPFLPMAMTYRWRGNTPGDRLAVHLENLEGGERVFDATLALAREPITPATLRRTILAYPFMTLKVCLAIYWQALKLFIRRVPLHAHPPAAPQEN